MGSEIYECICKIITKTKTGTGFFCNVPNKNIKLLITNNHVIDETFLNNEYLLKYSIIETEKEVFKEINLKKDRYKLTNKEFDFTIIEIIKEDNINNYLEINNLQYDINDQIFTFQYPGGGRMQYSHGKLIKKKENYLIHDIGSKGGSSGFPIILMKNSKVIGLHRGTLDTNPNNKINIGIIIELIIEKISYKKKSQKHNPKHNFRKYYDMVKRIKIYGEGFLFMSTFDILFDYFEVIEKETNQKKVIKILNKKRIPIKYVENEEDKKYIQNERYIDDLMKYLEYIKMADKKNKGNENVIKYYEYFHNEKEFAIVLELWDDNLFYYLKNTKHRFNVEEIYELLYQLKNTFEIMSENGIIHGNLNIENIFIKKVNNNKLIFKLSNNYCFWKLQTIIDKSIMRYFYLDDLAMDYQGPNYKKLHILKYEKRENKEVYDLFSLCFLIKQCLFPPFDNYNNHSYFPHKFTSETGNENLDDLLKKGEELKLTWKEYFNHPFFKK